MGNQTPVVGSSNKIPEWARTKIVADGIIITGTTSYLYYVLDKSLEPSLPGFIGFPRGEFLFISDEVPFEYREFMLRHEIREITEFKDKPGRCLECLKWELSEFVPDELWARYVEYRRGFFERLVAYYENLNDREHDELLREITKSRDFLRDLGTT